MEYLPAHVGTVEEMQDCIVALCSEEVVKMKQQVKPCPRLRWTMFLILVHLSIISRDLVSWSCLLRVIATSKWHSGGLRRWRRFFCQTPHRHQLRPLMLQPSRSERYRSTTKQFQSREYFASQLQRIDRRVSPFYVVQYDVEALLLSAISDPVDPTSTSISNLSRILLYDSNMDSDAFWVCRIDILFKIK